jgi:hypothetical protein
MTRKRVFVEAGAVWLALAAFGVVNGVFRRSVLDWSVGSEVAHILSTTTLAGAVFVAALLWVGSGTRSFRLTQLVWVGLLWAAATILFEVVLGRYAAARSWADILGDFELRGGRLFGLVILVELAAPLTVGLLRRWKGLAQARAHS